MNEQQRAVVQQALEAINEELAVDMTDMDAVDQAAEMLCKVSTDLRQLLEQPEPVQEPVAWYRDEDGIRIYYESKAWDDATPLYTTLPAQPASQRSENTAWVGLTDDEIYASYNEPRSDSEMVAFARKVEAKLREKNGHKL
jgi:hypothetical protein